MNENGSRYHSAFVELAKGSEIRPLRSRRNVVYVLLLGALIIFGSGLFTYSNYTSPRSPAVSPMASVRPVPEAPAATDLSPDAIERMQDRLHDRAPEAKP